MSKDIFLALGSNLGDRRANLRSALQAFPPKISLQAESRVYETRPWGMLDQPDFLNMVVQAQTDLSPLRLLNFLKKLETRLGRAPSVRYGPRSIDIDILFYGDLVMNTSRLTIPHPHLHERAFVLVPLADLQPDLVHPLLGRTIADLCSDLDSGGVKHYE